MYQIHFYQDAAGHQPVKEYIQELQSGNNKDSRIKLNKIRDYMRILELKGTRAGEPFVKHLEDNIWELRPLRDRILRLKERLKRQNVYTLICWKGVQKNEIQPDRR